jgi:hypothetical protein
VTQEYREQDGVAGVAVAEPAGGAAVVCAIAEGFPNANVTNVAATTVARTETRGFRLVCMAMLSGAADASRGANRPNRQKIMLMPIWFPQAGRLRPAPESGRKKWRLRVLEFFFFAERRA